MLRAAEELRRRRLDRSWPLWQMWLLPGLAEGQVGLYVKIHHVIGDATAGLAALAALLDPAPGMPAGPAAPWTPAPPPTARDLLADNLRHHATGLGHAAAALARPVTTTRHLRAAWTAAREVTTGPSATRTSLDRLVGPGRTLAPIRGSLDQVQQAAHRHHATVNDVLLAITAGGLRELLRSRVSWGAAMIIICTNVRRELTAHCRPLPAVLIAAALAVAALAGCSSPAPVNTQGEQILHLTIDSRFVHGAMPLTLVTPAGGGAHRPLLVFLHGLHSLGYDNNSQLTDQMFAALHALGPSAPDIAFPYGDDSYWVNSADGA